MDSALEPDLTHEDGDALAQALGAALEAAGGAPVQAPARQEVPAGQARPHMPQWAASVAGSTQTSPQVARPVGHAHTPAAQG